jgi:hypothetical protein
MTLASPFPSIKLITLPLAAIRQVRTNEVNAFLMSFEKPSGL